MKIKRIQVKNIGPYVNENAFDFDVSDIIGQGWLHYNSVEGALNHED